MRTGCSLAEMYDIKQTERGWIEIQKEFGDTIIPLTYVNSTAEIKGFVGRNGGATVTSSNAAKMLEWSLTKKERILFLRSEEHTSELQSRGHLVCRLLPEKKKETAT